jgi:TPR repeat protein
LEISSAHFELGKYYLGICVELPRISGYPERDATIAFQWFLKAAENDHQHSQFILGRMYKDGIGVEQSNEQAFKWFHKAAVTSLPQAQHIVGQYYEKGLLGEINVKEAYSWKLKAANQGLIEINGVLMSSSRGEVYEDDTFSFILEKF